MTCEHKRFRARVAVNRLAETDGGQITGYAVDIHVECAQCNLPFRFLGIAHGSHYAEPRVSVDATELRAPIEPAYVPELLGQPLVSGRG